MWGEGWREIEGGMGGSEGYECVVVISTIKYYVMSTSARDY